MIFKTLTTNILYKINVQIFLKGDRKKKIKQLLLNK